MCVCIRVIVEVCLLTDLCFSMSVPHPGKTPDADSVLPSAPSCPRCSWCAKLSESSADWYGLQPQCCSKNAPSSLPEFSNNPSISLSASMFAPFQTIFHKRASVIYLNTHTNIQAFHCLRPFNSFPSHCEHNPNSFHARAGPHFPLRPHLRPFSSLLVCSNHNSPLSVPHTC